MCYYKYIQLTIYNNNEHPAHRTYMSLLKIVCTQKSLRCPFLRKFTTVEVFICIDNRHLVHHRDTISRIFCICSRICTIVSDSKTRDIRLGELKLYLLRQKYPDQLVDNGIMKAKECDRKTLLSIKQQSNDEDVLPFVHTYNPRNININSVVFQLNNLLKEDAKTKEIYKNHRLKTMII